MPVQNTLSVWTVSRYVFCTFVRSNAHEITSSVLIQQEAAPYQ